MQSLYPALFFAEEEGGGSVAGSGRLAGHSMAVQAAAAAQAAMSAQVAALEQLRDQVESGEPPEKKMALMAEEQQRLMQRALQQNLLAMTTTHVPMNIRINNQVIQILLKSLSREQAGLCTEPHCKRYKQYSHVSGAQRGCLHRGLETSTGPAPEEGGGSVAGPGRLTGHSMAVQAAAAAQAAMSAQVAALEQLRDQVESGEPPEKKMALMAEEQQRLMQRALQQNLLAMTTAPMNIRINNQESRRDSALNLTTNGTNSIRMSVELNGVVYTGTPVNRIPIMAKQVLDLYMLYMLVTEKGGLVEVINKKLWREITKGLNLPTSITSAAFTLRTHLSRATNGKPLAPIQKIKKEEEGGGSVAGPGRLTGHSMAVQAAAAAQAAMSAQVAALEQLRDQVESGEPPEKKMALVAEEQQRLMQRALQQNLLAMTTTHVPMNIRINNQESRRDSALNLTANGTNSIRMSVELNGVVYTGALSVTVLKAAARSLSLSPGQTAVLDCSIERDSGELVSWYKQSPGDAPQFILSHHHTNSSAANYGSGFSSERFTAGAKDPLTYQLVIRSVEWSDVAVYYCGAWTSAHG
ncbi:UNVERIFIED_CONTAM: hypothetical protein FKN15_027132 [Acipenser sinensis]